MANEYLTLAQLKETFPSITGTSMDDELSRALEAASRAIDKACSRRGLRRFWPDTAPVERLYTPGDLDLLEIHDAIEITLVESDDDNDGIYESTWDASAWVPLPLNAALDGEPWTAIQWRGATTTSTRSFGFPQNVLAGVRVTGKFGWTAAPPAIVQATGILAQRLQKRAREAPFAVVGFNMDATAVHIARTDPDVSGLIHDFVRDTSTRSVRLG